MRTILSTNFVQVIEGGTLHALAPCSAVVRCSEVVARRLCEASLCLSAARAASFYRVPWSLWSLLCGVELHCCLGSIDRLPRSAAPRVAKPVASSSRPGLSCQPIPAPVPVVMFCSKREGVTLRSKRNTNDGRLAYIADVGLRRSSNLTRALCRCICCHLCSHR